MAERKQGERSKNDTWGEQELAKYMTGRGGGGARKTASGAHGSPKSQPKAHASPKSRSDKEPRKPSQSSSSSSKPPAPSPGGGRRARDATKAGEASRRTADRSDSKRSSDKSKEHPLLKSQEKGKIPAEMSQEKGPKAHTNPSRPAAESSKLTEGRSKPKAADTGSRQTRSEHRDRGKDEKIRTSSSQKKADSRSKDDVKAKSRGQRDGGHGGGSKRVAQSGSSKDPAAAGDRGREEPGSHGSRGEGHKARDVVKRKEVITVSEQPPAVLPSPVEGQPQPMVEVTEEEEEEYSQEDWEAEDYEEDFEEDLEDSEPSGHDDSEGEGPATPSPSNHHPWQQDGSNVDLVEIMQAIDAENLHASSTTQLGTDVPPASVPQVGVSPGPAHLESSPSRRFLDFSTARKKEVVARAARRTRKRGEELLGIIELDRVTFDLFHLPPLTEYELYVKKFGADNTRQVSVQTGEDVAAAEAQTDQVGVAERWVQWPPEDLRGFGGGVVELAGEEEPGPSLSGAGAVKLLSFLQRASQVCSVLLKENLDASGKHLESHSVKSPFPFCSSCLKIEPVPFYLAGRRVADVSFSPTQPHLFLAAYSLPPTAATAAAGGVVSSKGLVCVWSTRDTLQPQMVLESEAPPTCCCFSPQKASLAFAGMEDGSVVLWDLREPWAMHQQQPALRGLETPPRVPTFSTAGIPQLGNHQAPILSITPLATEHGNGASSAPPLAPGEEGEGLAGLSFQLSTLDTSGQLNLWVVVESQWPDPNGSETDLGLVPGGRVRLVKSATLDVSTPSIAHPPPPPGPFQVHSFQFHPQDTNNLYIGTDTGRVRHVTRYGKRSIPRYYTAGDSAAMCDVTSISFSARQPSHFLVGCSNGTLRLHQTSRADPVLLWSDSTDGVGVVNVKWVELQPGAFIVQDAQSTIYWWDLLQNDAEPIHKKEMTSSSITCLHLPPHPPKPHPSPLLLLIALSDDVMEVHRLAAGDDGHHKHTQFTNYLNALPTMCMCK